MYCVGADLYSMCILCCDSVAISLSIIATNALWSVMICTSCAKQ